MSTVRDNRLQYYLRAEPSPASRRILRQHQQQLAEACGHLSLSPRLTKPDDLHWTVLFLGSPDTWTRAFAALGVHARVSADDMLAWTDTTELRAALPRPAPTTYDIFYKGGTTAVFVLLLTVRNTMAETLLRAIRSSFHERERGGQLPAGTMERLFRARMFPLARERDGGTSHITLARSRVSRVRQRDVLRSLRTSVLASRDPLQFDHLTLRVVRSPTIVRTFR